ncbi:MULTISPECIES: fatty acid desaturase family protein [Alteribacter]|uniref:Acyl-CoA desaturase n=1 Tax=Alteribacter keqinensis TaxID=2483800 RepID=A0A3M7TMH4_9BACI|nr:MULTISPECIES: acyl-CoA desaturase [Alteribacter]MBM7095018.1 acyl-CoA desaturase [Alteribacter salitolerans]RNA66811.1 acyl-CoA desaturase [Alteribacter keqinensis]
MENNKPAEQAEFHSFGWYAARVSPHMPKKAFKAVPGRLWGGLIYAVIALGGIFSIAFFDLNIWLKFLIAGVLGSSFASLGFLGHEILHGTVVRKRWLRNFLGAVAFWPLTTGPELWKKWHNMEHHHHTQDEHKDPDAWPSVNKLAKSRFLRWMYRIPFTIRALSGFIALAFTFTLHSSHMFVTYIKDFNKEKQVKVWVQFILPWATWIGLLLWIGPVKWIFAFLLPLLIANFIVMAYISTNHRLNPLVPVNDPLANSLTVTVPKWVDVLHFNFSYHTEHHLFPGMNPKYYPIVKRRIKDMWPDRYHEMPMSKAMIALWKTPRVYFEQDQLVDPTRAAAYGSLGNGLDPNDIKSRDVDLSKLKLGKKKEE